MSIYSDLLEFKRGILGRTGRDLPGLHPTAQKAAAVDLQIIETQMHGYQSVWISGSRGSGNCRAFSWTPRTGSCVTAVVT